MGMGICTFYEMNEMMDPIGQSWIRWTHGMHGTQGIHGSKGISRDDSFEIVRGVCKPTSATSDCRKSGRRRRSHPSGGWGSPTTATSSLWTPTPPNLIGPTRHGYPVHFMKRIKWLIPLSKHGLDERMECVAPKGSMGAKDLKGWFLEIVGSLPADVCNL